MPIGPAAGRRCPARNEAGPRAALPPVAAAGATAPGEEGVAGPAGGVEGGAGQPTMRTRLAPRGKGKSKYSHVNRGSLTRGGMASRTLTAPPQGRVRDVP